MLSAVQRSKKRVLRARGGTQALLDAASAAGDEGDERFAGAFARLSSYKSAHRQSTKLAACRAEWVEQLASLRAAAASLSRDARAFAEPGGGGESDDGARRAAAAALDELRAMVACLAAAAAAAAEEPGDARGAARAEATALVARMLCGARDAHEARGAALARDAEDAAADLAAATAPLLRNLRDARAAEPELSELLAGGDLADADDADLEAARAELEAEWAARAVAEAEAKEARETAFFEALERLGDGGGDDARGAWDDASHDVFLQHVALRDGGSKTAAKALELLAVSLPEKHVEEIRAHVGRHEACRARARGDRAAREERKAWRDAFAARCAAALRSAADEASARRARDAECAELEARRKALHDDVAALRADRARRDSLSQHESEVAAEAAAAEADRAAEAAAVRREAARAAVLAYKAATAAARAEAAREAERRRAADELRKASRLKRNVARSSYRSSLRDDRRREAAVALDRAAAADAARALALEKLAASVPYYDAIQAAVADLSKTTAAAEAHRADNRPDPDACRTGLAYADGGVPGLSDERVFADVRFKLGFALRAAGLSGSVAAKAAVQRAVGPMAVNPLTGFRIGAV